ncbi:unnamed protein product [Porites lobata]|uniref:DNA-directed DNA polymerase n=1 Tax=Porites lobata TaxID=104759 RepID=A0ABN8P5U2_9CNID|nr:unnamed protein product [Porites lobata]
MMYNKTTSHHKNHFCMHCLQCFSTEEILSKHKENFMFIDGQQAYNPEKSSKYIHYLDANNLYGWAMSQCLPTGGFKWLTPKQINKIMSKTLLPDKDKGYIYIYLYIYIYI